MLLEPQLVFTIQQFETVINQVFDGSWGSIGGEVIEGSKFLGAYEGAPVQFSG